MIIKRSILLIILLVSQVLATRAVIYRNYFVEDGLSHNSVWAIMQDRDGFMWFGTNDGLNRFDGTNFRVFRHRSDQPGSIGHNFIHCLLETADGKFLVGTKEGLYSYDRTDETFAHIPLANQNQQLDKASVHCLLEDKSGNIWIGCYGDGIYMFDRDLNLVKHYTAEDLPSAFVNALCVDLSGRVWAGTDGHGLFSINPANGEVKLSDIDSYTVNTIYCDSNNNLWVGTSADGLYMFNPRSNDISRIRSSKADINNIKSITIYAPKTIIMSTEGGIILVNTDTLAVTPFNDDLSFDNLLDNSIFAICIDRDGGIWLGKYFTGVGYCSPAANQFTFYRNSNTGNEPIGTVLAIDESDDSNIWVGTRSQGLFRFDGNTSSMRPISPELSDCHIGALCADGRQLWIGIYNKCVALYDIASNKIVKRYTVEDGFPSIVVTNILKSTDGRVYFATDNGIAYIGEGGRMLTIPGMEHHPVKNLIDDYDGNIWAACHKFGIVKISTDHNGNFEVTPYSVGTDNVNSVFQDKNGQIWVGSESDGIFLLDAKTGEQVAHLDQHTSLPSNMIYTFEEDVEGNIWTSTGGGLAKIEKDTYRTTTFKPLEELLHFSYSHLGSLQTHDNKLYYGGSTGLLSFDPLKVGADTPTQPVQITGFCIDGKEQIPNEDGSPLTKAITITESISLAADQNRFSFDVTGLDFYNVSQTEIYYMLEGYDKDWNVMPASRGFLSYTNIPSGTYNLILKSSNDGGITFSPLKTLSITVRKPWYLTTPVLIILFLIIAAILYMFVKMWIRRVNAANTEKMYRFTAESERQLYDQKISFFTNIAHEIRTPLSLISAPLDSIIKSGDGNNKTRDNLGIIRKNVARLLELINQLLDFRKAEVQQMQMHYVEGDIVPVLEDICQRYREYGRLHDITINCKFPPADELPFTCDYDPEAIEKIVGNLLSNAIKFTDKKIDLTLRNDGDRMVLTIADDGPGVKDSDKERIFESFYQVDDTGHHRGTGLGLPLARTLATLHGGTLEVESEYGHGCTFILNLPRYQALPEKPTTTEAAAEVQEGSLDEALPENTEGIMLLLVEDNDELRTFIAGELDEFYTVIQATNGVEALRLLDKYPVSIIVSDIMMPEMDGLEFCQAVRSRVEHSHLPFILLSAKTDVGTKIEGLNYGADAYLEKPFVVEQLHAQINTLLEHDRRIRCQLEKSPLDFYKKAEPIDDHDKETAEFINNLNNYILENLTDKDFSIDTMARYFLMSRSNFHKKVKAITGKTPNDYIRIVRLNRSVELLQTGKYQIVEVCYMVGFNTPWYFSKCFNEHFGKLPNEYLKDNNL